jgi:hypothetical protein
MRKVADNVTLPTSTRKLNAELDARILRNEPADEITRAACWYQRRFATAFSTAQATPST